MESVLVILSQGAAAVTATNLAEVFDVSARREGLSVPRVEVVVEPLLASSLLAIPVDLHLATRAAEIRAEHYHRTSCPLSLADAILLAAPQPGDKIATTDLDVLVVAAKIGIETVELPRKR